MKENATKLYITQQRTQLALTLISRDSALLWLPGQLSLAISPWVGKMSTGDDYGHRQGRNGEFCVTVGPVPGLLTY